MLKVLTGSFKSHTLFPRWSQYSLHLNHVDSCQLNFFYLCKGGISRVNGWFVPLIYHTVIHRSVRAQKRPFCSQRSQCLCIVNLGDMESFSASSQSWGGFQQEAGGGERRQKIHSEPGCDCPSGFGASSLSRRLSQNGILTQNNNQ